jgi:hypothetical protein
LDAQYAAYRNGTRHQECSFDVHGLHQIECFLVQFDDRHAVRTRGRTRVVDEYVDLSEAIERRAHHLPDLSRVGDSTRNAERVAAHRLDFINDCRQPPPVEGGIVIEVGNSNIGALTRELQGDCPTQSEFAARTGNQRDSSL